MPNAFNFSTSPFDCLTTAEQRLVRDSVDIAYFRKGEAVLEVGTRPEHLFVVIKGFVEQFDDDEVVATYAKDDTFDGRGLVAGKTSSRFVAGEEVLAYQLAKQAVSELISTNATFGALLFSDITRKLGALAERQSQHELQSLTMARVAEVALRPPHFVDGNASVLSVVRLFRDERTTSVLVRDGDPPRIGLFSVAGLQRAVLADTPLAELTVAAVASFPLITVAPNEYLFDALARMIRHRVQRLVVVDGERIVGVLEQLALLSFLSNHSYLITLQILEADDLESLKSPAAQITRVISLLHRSGTRVGLIAKLVQELNAKLFERAWQLIAPPDLIENSCLFVMGSEGRGEQLLKTDQDNGLILRDDYACPHDLEAICRRFSEALSTFGYPECPGAIMVSNPAWRMTAEAFAAKVRRWLQVPDADSLMALAIFVDAHPVAGDGALLERVRSEIHALIGARDVNLSHFAQAIDTFADTTGWWNRLLLRPDEREGLNLKKMAIFPLVHGVRALALQQHVSDTGTAARVDALVASGRLTRAWGDEIVDTLHFLMGLKLSAGLQEIESGREVSGGVPLDRLSTLERDLLKDAFAVVKRFKTLLRHHFRLDQL